jgi:indolepyruvate ferredoxin oxidoreductase beta subunit
VTFNYLIAGVGGQGTVLASKLVAAAAMKRGYEVRTTETIGMAQRGGSVVSHVRIGENIFSPLLPLGSAKAMIAFEPAEAVRYLPYLSRQDTLIVCDAPVMPISGIQAGAPYEAGAMLDHLRSNAPRIIIIRGQPIKERYAKMLNVALLGAAAQAGVFPFDEEALRETIGEMPRYREENLKSFELGGELYNEYSR